MIDVIEAYDQNCMFYTMVVEYYILNLFLFSSEQLFQDTVFKYNSSLVTGIVYVGFLSTKSL